MHSASTVSPGEVDPVDGEQGHGYTPPGDAPRIVLNTHKPSVKTLDKKKVAIIGGCFAIAILFAFIEAFSPQDHTKAKSTEAGPQPVAAEAENLNHLPSDYKKLAQQRAESNGVPQLGAPMPGELGGAELAQQRSLQVRSAGDPSLTGGYGGSGLAGPYSSPSGQITPMQQLAQQQAMDRLQRAANARNAGSGFDRGGQAQAPGSNGGGGTDPLASLAAQLAGNSAAAMAGANAGNSTKGRDDANRQDDKLAFTDGRKLASAQLDARLLAAPDSFVGAGTIIPALFLTGVNSDLPGLVTAQVAQPVYDSTNGNRILIPQGAVLIGEYDSRVTYGQNRVLLVWQRIRFPNGTSLSLDGMPGVDMSGYAGVQDNVNNHWGKLAGAVVLSSVLGASVASTQGDTFSATNPSLSQQAAQAAGASINQAGQKLVERALNIQPTLEIRPGQRVAVMVSKDLLLAPYAP